MSPRCTCPIADPAERATTYTHTDGTEPHAVDCPRWGHPVATSGEWLAVLAVVQSSRIHDRPRLAEIVRAEWHAALDRERGR